MPGLGETVADLARYRRWTAGSKTTGSAQARSASALSETVSFGDNPGDLRLLAYAPASAPSNAPLVVVLHGCTQSAEAYAEGAGWIELADRHGLILLCPEQKAANNFNRCFDWFQPEDTVRGGGEAASIRQMIQHVSLAQSVDPARIYVTGLSAGGAMTAVMLAAYPEIFAGGAIIAGLPYGAANSVQEAFGAMFQGRSRSAAAWGDLVRDASPHKGEWPRVAIWQGDADSTVRPSNADEIVKQWANLSGLAATPDQTTHSRGIKRSVWKSADGADAIQLNVISGLGHGTPIAAGGPDGCGRPGPFLLESGVSSSDEILRFWGLEDAAASASSADPAEPKLSAVPPAGRARHPGAGKPRIVPSITPDKVISSVEQVIAKALTAAGLLK